MKILCINLPGRKDRFDHFKSEFDKIDFGSEFIRINALKHSVGWLGCMLTYLSIFEQFKDEELLLIFEDDVLFMDGPGVATRLFHEIEFFDDGSGELVAWVNIPSLSAGEDTVLYLYYGNPDSGNQQDPEDVWDSNYVLVQHMNDRRH